MPPSRGLPALKASGWSPRFVAQCRARTWQDSTRSFSVAATARPHPIRPSFGQQRYLRQPDSHRHLSWFSRAQPETQASPQAPATHETFIAEDASPSAALHPPAEPPLDPVADTHTAYSNDFIGFLTQDYGIDFGFGTSTLMKALFEHVHVYTGLPFVGSIVLTGAIIRFGMMFATKSTVDNSARMQAMMPLTKPLMARANHARATGDNVELQRVSGEVKQIYRDSGIKMYKYAYSFLNIPLGFGCWRTFRAMSDTPVAGMTTGGLSWFKDLTIADPYYVLPVVTAAMQHFSAKWAAENQSAAMSDTQRNIQQGMIYGLPVLTVLIIGFAPAAVQLHFATTATFALITNVAFKSPTVRGWLRMTPKPKEAKPQQAYGGTINVAGRSSPTGAEGGRPRASSSAAQAPGWMQKVGLAGIWTSAQGAAAKLMPTREEAVKKRQARGQKDKAREYERRRSREIEEARVNQEKFEARRRKA